MPVGLLQNLNSLVSQSRRNLPIGGSSAQSMHHHGVALSLHPLQQLAHPAVAHSHPLGRLPLTDHLVLSSFQPLQPVPFLLAHRDSFHPSALRLSRGTFYFGQLGIFHFGATIRYAISPARGTV